MSPPQIPINVEAQEQLSVDMKFFQDYVLREQQLRAAETQIRAADSHRQSDMQAQLLKMMKTVIDRLPHLRIEISINNENLICLKKSNH